jgi:hypothetical protein
MRTALQYLAVALALLCSAVGANAEPRAEAVTITFDDLANGTQLADQYKDLGVVFSGTYEPTFGTAGVVATEGVAGTQSFGNSAPNLVIVGLGSVTASFVDPESGDPATAQWISVRLGDGDSASEIVGVNAFAPSGELVFSTVVHLIDEGVTLRIDPKAEMAKVRIFALAPPEGSGVNMDDFSFRLQRP